MMVQATPTDVEGTRGRAALPVGAAAADRDIEDLRQSIRRFAHTYAKLPVETRATCPLCRQVVPATFDRVGRQIVLSYRCKKCGESRQVHADAIWSQKPSDFPGSPTRTRSGAPIQPVLRRLPRTVETLCPVCSAVVLGRYFVEDGAVHIEKTCPAHGHFRDCVNSDALLQSKAAWWTFEEPAGPSRPGRTEGQRCPSDCGLCRQHQSTACLAQIDLTSRCNMHCPVCFADAGAGDFVYEPTYAQVVELLSVFRDMGPYPATAVQFTGGEPTVHPRFLEIVAKSRQMGFSHIQVATNGLRMTEPDFAAAAAEAGLHTLYLQFDGVGPEPYRLTRNYPGIWEKKLACIENCRRLDLKVCLVPTIIKGVNDDQVGEIFRFAVENVDVVSGISYQPVSFSGRTDPTELAARRYTLGDLAHDIAEASGASPLRDMYPLSMVVPLAQFLQAVTGDAKIRPSCHPDCAFGTYFLVSPDGQAYPFPQVVDVEGMFTDMNRLARRLDGKSRLSWLDRMAILRMFRRHFRRGAAPPGLDVKKFVRSLQGLLDKSVGRGAGERNTYKTLLCAGMHFQDRYNYDVQRTKRCVILYSTPEGVFPFCSYNCGPEYRHYVERKHRRRAGPAESPPTQTATEEG